MTRQSLAALMVNVLIFFLGIIPCSYSQTKPTVVSTIPANGATGVSPLLAAFSVTFSKPMDTTRCAVSTRSWPYGPGGTCTWSSDGLTMTLTRYNPQTPFTPGLTIGGYINDPENAPLIRDTQGNFADTYYFSFTIALRPTVVSTSPADGAANVSAYLPSISITFSKPMDTTRCGVTGNWPYDNGGSCTWSADKLTMTLTRPNSVLQGVRVVVYLNWPDDFLRDTDGIYVGMYSFAFTLTADSSTVLKIAADPKKGFQWPYYLYVPSFIKSPTVLLVESNNSGLPTVDDAQADNMASIEFNNYKWRAAELWAPSPMPTFPRPPDDVANTQSLDRNTLTTNLPGLVRIDLQLIAMIDDARDRLAVMGINAGPKVWMMGFSASGAFANRFALLHPDRIQAMSAGSGNEYATAPVAVWKGKTLPYPVGVADLEQLVGRPFDTATFSKMPVQLYIGDQQVADAFFDKGPTPASLLIDEVFGGPTFRRYPASEAAYLSIGSPCQFVIFPGMGHVWPDWSYIKEFFERNRTEPFPPPLPKPLLYTQYFPHVANYGEWQTEIALTNTSEVAVHGELRGMGPSGGAPLESIPVSMPAGGRVEITVGKSFHRSQEIAYLQLVSDSGFLAGYLRFYQPGNRASLALGSGSNQGWFTKLEKQGWTGVAFVNVDTVASSVDLTAYDDDGNQVATAALLLTPGQKTVCLIEQLFQSDIRNATHIRFHSDQKLLGFTVSGSADGQMLDGLHALGDYISAKK